MGYTNLAALEKIRDILTNEDFRSKRKVRRALKVIEKTLPPPRKLRDPNRAVFIDGVPSCPKCEKPVECYYGQDDLWWCEKCDA